MVATWICYNKKNIQNIKRVLLFVHWKKWRYYIVINWVYNCWMWVILAPDFAVWLAYVCCLPNQPPTKVTFVTEAGLILQIQTNATSNKSISILKNYSRNLICLVLPTNPYTRENTFFSSLFRVNRLCFVQSLFTWKHFLLTTYSFNLRYCSGVNGKF